MYGPGTACWVPPPLPDLQVEHASAGLQPARGGIVRSGALAALVGADLPGAGALLVGLGGRPVWVRLILLGLACAALLVAIFLAIDNESPLELLFAIPALAVIVAVLRARRPPASTGEGNAAAGSP